MLINPKIIIYNLYGFREDIQFVQILRCFVCKMGIILLRWCGREYFLGVLSPEHASVILLKDTGIDSSVQGM